MMLAYAIMQPRPCLCLIASMLLAAGCASALANPKDYFVIKVVDEATGRGVPLVQLTTTNSITCVTDSNGLIAFNEPGLMNLRVWFEVNSHGYEIPANGFGMHGVALDAKPGASATIEIKRLNVAERLYRITGQGIYRDTVLLGKDAPIAEPLLNAQVMGQDSIQATPYRNQLYWFWGDTSQVAFGLGLFKMAGATSAPADEIDPAVGYDLHYFTGENGFARAMAPLEGKGVVWLGGVVALPDKSGNERLLAYFHRREGMGELYEQGFVIYNDELEQFEKLSTVPNDSKLMPAGFPTRVEEDGRDYVYFTAPYPCLRVPADAEHYADLSKYETFTCLERGTFWSDAQKTQLDRDSRGRLNWAWKKATGRLGPREQEELIQAGRMKRAESPFRLEAAEDGKPVSLHHASVFHNQFRQRYVMCATQFMGDTPVGEVWYAESKSMEGPWEKAVKIITHANVKNDPHDFYNAVQHPFFDREGGRFIFIEGTYVNTFSGIRPTPRYEYNQIMYRLDLDDPRLSAAHVE